MEEGRIIKEKSLEILVRFLPNPEPIIPMPCLFVTCLSSDLTDVTLVIGHKFDQMYLLISSMQYGELWQKQFLLEMGVAKRRHWDFYSCAREVKTKYIF